MNNKQLDALKRLEDQLRERRDLASRLPNRGESKEQYLFTEVQGVTVIIGPRGGYQLPAVRRYPETSKPGENRPWSVCHAVLQVRATSSGNSNLTHELLRLRIHGFT